MKQYVRKYSIRFGAVSKRSLRVSYLSFCSLEMMKLKLTGIALKRPQNGKETQVTQKRVEASRFHSISFQFRTVIYDKGGKFLKKLWCCVGGSITVLSTGLIM